MLLIPLYTWTERLSFPIGCHLYQPQGNQASIIINTSIGLLFEWMVCDFPRKEWKDLHVHEHLPSKNISFL